MRLTTLIGEKIDEAYTVYMINLLLLTLSLANTQPTQTAQFKPCVWPNVCNEVAASVQAVAQVRTCVWPNVCKTEAAPVVAQFRPCVWPNVCKNATAVPADDFSVISVEVAQFTTCVFPRKCGKNA